MDTPTHTGKMMVVVPLPLSLFLEDYTAGGLIFSHCFCWKERTGSCTSKTPKIYTSDIWRLPDKNATRGSLAKTGCLSYKHLQVLPCSIISGSLKAVFALAEPWMLPAV